ncbi:uncharacterized protein LOC125532061 [Triticum urartu]|uniref:uncharacterized protein LOC125532061 n=1 Tax=Triticum urartu TaxID=4572 RepID=UPI0020437C3C|nr:uncharacterized protein LOC125532061 [Triticum urartu]
MTIWKSECPGKVKQFLWRLAHNSLPHRWRIERRGMEIDTLCPMCGRLNEDGAHLFLKCKFAKSLWREMQLNEERERLLACDGPKEMIYNILKLPEEKKLKCVMMLWAWWDVRNKEIAGEPSWNPSYVARRVNVLVEDWLRHGLNAQLGSQDKTECSVHLGQEVLQINVDGSMRENPSRGGWGFIIKDAKGQPVGAVAGHMQHISDPLQAEATTCLQGLYAAESWGMMRVQVQTDSLNLVQALNTRDLDLAANGVLFKEIRCFASLNFNQVVFSFCPRACNKVADALASFGAESDLIATVMWPDQAPEFVHGLVASDCAELFG